METGWWAREGVNVDCVQGDDDDARAVEAHSEDGGVEFQRDYAPVDGVVEDYGFVGRVFGGAAAAEEREEVGA